MALRLHVWWFSLTVAANLIHASSQGADPAALARQASAALKSRQFEAAERIYLDLVQESPVEPGLALKLALAQYSAGKFEDALKQIRRFLDTYPNHGLAGLSVGISHQKLERRGDASYRLKLSVELDPSNRRPRLKLADALPRSCQSEPLAGAFVGLGRGELSKPRAGPGLDLSHGELPQLAAETLDRTAPNSGHRRSLWAHDAQVQRHFMVAFRDYPDALASDPAAAGTHEVIAGIYKEIRREDWSASGPAEWLPIAPCRERQLEF